MKQILITPEIEAMAEEYAGNLFANKRASFVQPIEGLKSNCSVNPVIAI